MSLRHTRLLRIISMIQRGETSPHHRNVKWGGRTFAMYELELEGCALTFNLRRGVRMTLPDPRWDRRWLPIDPLRKDNVRDRTAAGRRLRRMIQAPRERGVTQFFSESQMRRMLTLVTAPDNVDGQQQDMFQRPRKLTFDEFKARWIR